MAFFSNLIVTLAETTNQPYDIIPKNIFLIIKQISIVQLKWAQFSHSLNFMHLNSYEQLRNELNDDNNNNDILRIK